MTNAVRRNRQMIYIGDHLRALLDKLPALPLSTVVNLIAERYHGIVERTEVVPMMDFHAALYCNVLREMDHALSSAEINVFPLYVKDWLRRHPEFPQGPGETALGIVTHASYHELVALVDRMEKNR